MIALTRYRNFMFIGATLLAMGAAYWFGIRYLNRLIVEGRDAIERNSAIAENREARVGRMNEYESQAAHIAEASERLRVFVERDDEVQFIASLERLAKDLHLAITFEERDGSDKVKPVSKAAPEDDTETAENKPKGKKPATLLGALPNVEYFRVAVRTSGRYEDAARFLHKVEALPYLTDVIAIDVMKRERLPEDNSGRPFSATSDTAGMLGEEVVFTIDLVVYRQPQDQKK